MPPKNKKNQEKAKNSGTSVDNEELSAGAVFLNNKGELCLSIHAKPGACETKITDIQVDSVGVKIAAPPIDGEANKELTKYMSKLLGLSKSDVVLDKGSKNRYKVLILTNCKLSPHDILDLLQKEVE